jgi:protoheme ferro-lyase
MGDDRKAYTPRQRLIAAWSPVIVAMAPVVAVSLIAWGSLTTQVDAQDDAIEELQTETQATHDVVTRMEVTQEYIEITTNEIEADLKILQDNMDDIKDLLIQINNNK